MSKLEKDIPQPSQKDSLPVCGIIMPISDTKNHNEKHWNSVQQLLHRVISEAGFSPKNVWDNPTTDRISERIIGNIFSAEIAITDITDMNPNVMFELGLRLSSKKPTIVVASQGCDIPFDIRDFHVVMYPDNLNILEMEDFFVKLDKILKEKYQSYIRSNYMPFLGDIIVEVASPSTKEVGIDDIILSKMNEISDRITSFELNYNRTRPSPPPMRVTKPPINNRITVKIPNEKFAEYINIIGEKPEITNISLRDEDSEYKTINLALNNPTSTDFIDSITELTKKYSGNIIGVRL